MREVYKDIALGEHYYRVGKMTARNGSWVAMQFASYVLPAAAQSAANVVDISLPTPPSRARSMTEAEFHNIQDHCLAVCSRKKIEPTGAEVFYPLIHDSGRWNFPDLEADVVTIMVLTLQALWFNIAPFFEDGALQQLTSSLTMLPTAVSRAVGSTGTSTVQWSQDTGGNMKHGTEPTT